MCTSMAAHTYVHLTQTGTHSHAIFKCLAGGMDQALGALAAVAKEPSVVPRIW